jgi:two-component system cell cycle response regulator
MTARVLVVDDVLPNVKVLEAKLSSEYFDVLTASSGAEALEAVRREHPDIILLDVMMPEMDGFEVCRRLKADVETAHIPVVMVTALSEPEDRVVGLEAGADDFLTKPVDDVALFARVRSLVRLKQMMDELRVRERTSSTLGVAMPEMPAPEVAVQSGSVLIVDDEAHEAERLIAALAGKFAAEAVADAQEAAARARGGDFDVVVVSADLQSADGLRLCSHLRGMEETRQLPILLLVDSDDRQRLVKGLEIGVTDYVLRPIDRNEFVARSRAQVRRKRYQDRLRQHYQQSMAMAVTDALTGLYNRHYMTAHLANLLARGEAARPLTLMMLDIDFFKRVNDSHGHAAGDEVLAEFARRMVRNVRGVDLACRYGGEEFVVVLPETDLANAVGVAERLRRSIEKAPFALSGPAGEIAVTCSIGLAASRPADSIDSLLKRADEALYRAKRDGRNRVVTTADLEEPIPAK